MKKVFALLSALIIMVSFFVPSSAAFAEVNRSAPLSVEAVGISSGTYATDEDSFTVARNPDYGELTFDENVTEYLTDGDVTTFWENTGNHGRNPFNPDKNEYIVIDLGSIKKITGVELTASNHGGFPEKMSCEYAVSQKDIRYYLAGSVKTLAKAPAAGEKASIEFNGTVARYLIVNIARVFVHTTYKEIHKQDIFDVCISDIAVFGTGAAQAEIDAALKTEANRIMTSPRITSFMVDTSSVLDTKYDDGTYAYDPSNLLDGNLSTLWYNSFSATSSENCDEYILLQTTDTETADFRELVMYAMPSRDFFPKDFVIQYSFDGLHWVDIEGQSYKNYTDDASGGEWEKIENVKQSFIFDEPVLAKYIRIYITKKSGAFDVSLNDDYYMLSLSEIEISACEADPAAARDAEAEFWKKLEGKNDGNGSETIEIKTDAFTETLFIILAVVCLAAGIAVTIVYALDKRKEGN